MAGRPATTHPTVSGTAPAARRQILFAAMTEKWPIAAMLRAASLANALAADLHVVRVYTLPRSDKRRFGRPASHDPLAAPDHDHCVADDAWRWCNHILPGVIRDEYLSVVQGDFVQAVITRAQKIQAELVILPEESTGVGLRANRIAVGAQVPVLISRLPRTHNTILAATDLSDSRYPVVCQAAHWRSMLAAELVLIHNVPPLAAKSGIDKDGRYWDVSRDQAVANSTEQLESVARLCSPCVATIVTNQLNTKRAILATAQRHDADLVAVGARPVSALARLVGGSVATRVAEQAQRSVLFVPMSAAAS